MSDLQYKYIQIRGIYQSLCTSELARKGGYSISGLMILLGFVAIAFWPSYSEASSRKLSPIDCVISIGGETFADGACQWRSEKSGSFTVYSGKYSASVDVDHLTAAHPGYWNAGVGSDTKPDIALGLLEQDGACWKNATATICAWKIGERQARAGKQTHSANKVRKSVTGRIGVGTLDSGIEVAGSNGEKSFGFLTQSPVADKIFKVCGMDDLCLIDGVFDENREWIDSVIRVEKLGSVN